MDDSTLSAAAESLAAQGITEGQLTALLRESRGESPSSPALVPVPSSAPSGSGPVAGSLEDRQAGALALAEAALADQARQEKLAAGARVMLQQKGLDLAWDEYDPAELVHLAGLGPNPNESPQQRAQRERIEHEDALVNDPAALAAEMHRRDTDDFRRMFWQRSQEVRVSEAERLGIDLSTYDPPESFNGLS